MQKTSRLTKWATACASWPRSRNRWASCENSSAASSVSICLVLAGFKRSGSRKQLRSRSRVAPSSRSSSANSCTSCTVLVQLVWTRNRSMSLTISSGGLSSAMAYCWSWAKARSRPFFLPLYSQAKHSFRQTSAQPSPPPVFDAPFSKVNHSPLGSALIGSSMSSRRQMSLKCDWEAVRSFSSAARHFWINSAGVMSGGYSAASRSSSA